MKLLCLRNMCFLTGMNTTEEETELQDTMKVCRHPVQYTNHMWGLFTGVGGLRLAKQTKVPECSALHFVQEQRAAASGVFDLFI